MGIDEIKARIKELDDGMNALECSDNFLFTNLNGNLPTYKAWEREKSELYKQLKEKQNEQ